MPPSSVRAARQAGAQRGQLHPVAFPDAELGGPSAADLEHRGDRLARRHGVVRSSGSALAIRAIVPSARMKMMSSGISVFFIQKRHVLRRIVGEDHAPVAGQRAAEHQPALLLLGRRRDLDREAMVAVGRMDRSAALRASPVCARASARRATLCAGACGLHATPATASAAASPANRRARAARPRSGPWRSARSALRASGPAEARGRCAMRTVSMCTNTSSPPTSSGRLTKP